MTLDDFQVQIQNLRVNVMLQRMEEAEENDPLRPEDDELGPLAGLTPLAKYHLSLALAALDTAEHHVGIAAYHQQRGH